GVTAEGELLTGSSGAIGGHVQYVSAFELVAEVRSASDISALRWAWSCVMRRRSSASPWRIVFQDLSAGDTGNPPVLQHPRADRTLSPILHFVPFGGSPEDQH